MTDEQSLKNLFKSISGFKHYFPKEESELRKSELKYLGLTEEQLKEFSKRKSSLQKYER